MRTLTVSGRAAGMSLVELMVGMLIGLIGIIIITHLYITNEQYKRRTTASGSAQSNGAIALFAIERDLRQAAFGLNHSKAFACTCDPSTNAGCSNIQYCYDGTCSFPPKSSQIGARNSLSLRPVVITDSTNGPDSISIFYGSDNERILATRLQFPLNTFSDDIKVDGTSGYEAIVGSGVVEPGNLLVLQRDEICALVQVTGKTADALKHDPLVTAAKWNLTGGLTIPAGTRLDGSAVAPNHFNNSTLVFNLGSRPNWRSYSILVQPGPVNTGRLQLTDQFRVITNGAQSEDIMDGIFDLQAQYGLDTNADGVVDVWTKCIKYPDCAATPQPTEAHWIKVIAIRLAVLARSAEYIKPTIGTTCDATTSANRPTWSGSIYDATTNPIPSVFSTLDATGVLPSCYKYRVFETTVPLRNMLWRPA